MQEADISRSAVEAFAHTSPYIKKWTKNMIGTLITVGGLGASPVGTPQTVADELQRWVDEADVDGFNFVSSGLGFRVVPHALVPRFLSLYLGFFAELIIIPGIRSLPLFLSGHRRTPSA